NRVLPRSVPLDARGHGAGGESASRVSGGDPERPRRDLPSRHPHPHLRRRHQRDAARSDRAVRPRHAGPAPHLTTERTMDFSLTDEQRALSELAAQILTDCGTASRLKAVEASDDGYDREAWAALAKAGLLGAARPESFGGSGGGLLELCLVLEQQGKRVVQLPLLSTLAAVALPLVRFGSAEQQKRFLPGVV